MIIVVCVQKLYFLKECGCGLSSSDSLRQQLRSICISAAVDGNPTALVINTSVDIRRQDWENIYQLMNDGKCTHTSSNKHGYSYSMHSLLIIHRVIPISEVIIHYSLPNMSLHAFIILSKINCITIIELVCRQDCVQACSLHQSYW